MTDTVVGFVRGTEPRILSETEAADAQRMASLPVVDHFRLDDLPVVRFPIRFKIASRPTFTGDIGGIRFENGVTVALHPRRRVMNIAAAFGAVIEARTGLVITPLGENRTFRSANVTWNYGAPLPTDVAAIEAAPAPAPKTVKAPPALDEAKIERVKAAIGRLRPGHKEDWTSDGRPDANRLAELLKEKVLVAERDRAWSEFQEKFEQDLAAFGRPEDDKDVAKVLHAVMQQKGKVYLRQVLQKRTGTEDSPRDGQKIIEELLKAGITLEEARAL